jgi:hypothetical protein
VVCVWTYIVGLVLEKGLPLVFVGLPLDSFYQSLVNMSIGLFSEVGKVTLQGNADEVVSYDFFKKSNADEAFCDDFFKK